MSESTVTVLYDDSAGKCNTAHYIGLEGGSVIWGFVLQNEALTFKPEVRRFHSLWRHWIFGRLKTYRRTRVLVSTPTLKKVIRIRNDS
jgi:hypothetical protein